METIFVDVQEAIIRDLIVWNIENAIFEKYKTDSSTNQCNIQ